MTYQKKLRKKGLQSRLTKKKRKGERKQRKTALKTGEKSGTAINGSAKPTKPIFNSDGNPVSNKFDFADSETKKEHKRKLGSTGNELSYDSNLIKHGNQGKKTSFNSTHGFTDNTDKCIFSNITGKQTDKPNLSESKSVELFNKEAPNQGLMFNKDNKMVFSKVFIPESSKKHKKKTDNNPKKLLKKIKENSLKISELEKDDKEKAVSLKEKQKWAAALKRASGEKVKDDPELLKKSISREKNKKMRSQKKWKARLDHMQKDNEQRQKKRMENIQAKKNEKKKRKIKKAIKKGSYVQV